MKFQLTFVLVALLLTTSCKSSFVGTVTFKTTVKAQSKELTQVYQNDIRKYGDTLEIAYCANGDMTRFHKSASPERGLNFEWYRASRGEIYFTFLNGRIDTFQVATNSLKKIRQTRMADETIAGYLCKCYAITAQSEKQEVNLNICYPKNNSGIEINPRLYKSYRSYFLYEFYKKERAPYLRYHIDYNTISIHYDGIEITPKRESISISGCPPQN